MSEEMLIMLVMLGIGVTFMLVVFLLAVIDEYLHGHDC